MESMAGWLFADLLLVLFIVGLGTEITQARETTPPPPPPAVEQKRPEMRQEPVTFEIEVDADALLAGDPAEKERVANQVAAETSKLSSSQAVLVLAFGYAPDPGTGGEISEAVGEIITTMDAPFAPQTQVRDFWKGNPEDGRVRLEVFVLDNPPTASP